MQWNVLVVLSLLAVGSVQALSHDDGHNDVDVTVEGEGDAPDDANETVGAGRGADDGDGIATPWAILMVLGVLVVVGVVAALFFAARNR